MTLHLPPVGVHRDIEQIIVVAQFVQPAEHRCGVLRSEDDAVHHIGRQWNTVVDAASRVVRDNAIPLAETVQKPLRMDGGNVGSAAGADDHKV